MICQGLDLSLIDLKILLRFPVLETGPEGSCNIDDKVSGIFL